MFRKQKADVVVVGAGPVGLLAAAALNRRGLDVRIVDAEWQGAGLSYALGLHPRSLDLLDEFGLVDAIVRDGYHVERIVFYEGTDRKAEVDLTAVGGKHPFLTIVPQSAMEWALEEWLKEHGVKISWRHRVTRIEGDGDEVDVVLERWEEDTMGYAVAHRERVIEKVFPVRSRFVIGADGHSSVIRRHLDIAYDQLAEPDLFAVFEFKTDADLSREARVILNHDTTNVLWPLPGGRCRWSFQLTDPEEFTGDRVKNRLSELGRWIFPSLTQDRLQAFIAERAPWFTSAVEEVIWSVAIRFERRLAAAFGRDRLWLAGDAAHLASPLGIHSMNVGFREAQDLAERMKAVLGGETDLSTFAAYDAERRAEWRRLLDVGGGLQAAAHADPFVRKNAGRILGALPASGRDLDTLLGQLGLAFGDG